MNKDVESLSPVKLQNIDFSVAAISHLIFDIDAKSFSLSAITLVARSVGIVAVQFLSIT